MARYMKPEAALKDVTTAQKLTCIDLKIWSLGVMIVQVMSYVN